MCEQFHKVIIYLYTEKGGKYINLVVTYEAEII